MEGLVCYGPMCFVNMSATDPKLFGFSEFLSGLALMVLAWTIADVRYRFRLRTAPIPLQGISFSLMSALGLMTLLTDLWRAQEWYVPVGPLNPAVWQAILGGLFLLTFFMWAWFAFIRPPKFGALNSERFTRVLYKILLNGSQEELSVIADELLRSVKNVVHHGSERRDQIPGRPPPPKMKRLEENANAILLLISDPRFCRAIVGSAPATALAIFQDVAFTRKFRLPIETFAKNIVLEAMDNRDSFIFHESDGYHTGLLGYHKPLTKVMFGNYEMVEEIRTLLDPDGVKMMGWGPHQWEAYGRVALLAIKDLAAHESFYNSHILFRVKGHLSSAVRDLYKLDGVESIEWGNEPWSKLRVVVKFLKDAIEELDRHKVPAGVRLRSKEHDRNFESVYDQIAELIFEIVFASAQVTSPRSTCWSIQHNSLWTDLFWSVRSDGPASKVIYFKLRRLMYNEVLQMNEFVNFKGARILGYCLNVMGLEVKEERLHSQSALHRVVLAWTKKHFAWLHKQNPEVADACLVDGYTYDKQNNRIVRTYPAGGLQRKPVEYFFLLDQVPNEEP